MALRPPDARPRRAPLRAMLGVVVGACLAALLPPVLWAALGGAAAPAFPSDLLAVAVAGAAVAAAAVASVVVAWEREVLSLPTTTPRPPTTATSARLAWSLHALETRLARALGRLRRARHAAEEAQRFESAFVRQLSHELRTPLNAILGFSRLLLDDVEGPLTPAQQEDLEAIQASGALLRELVDDVLDLAALQSDGVRLERTAVDPGPLVAGVATLLRGQVDQARVALELDVPPALPTVHADPKRLRQILVNLGTNAVKFTREGRVRLAVAADGDGAVRFTVEDTGPGIAPGELGTLFDEFVQASAGGAARAHGSGLGLAIVRRLARLHGGRVDVESALGVGTAFHVVLPAGCPDADAPAQAGPAPPAAADTRPAAEER